MHSSPLRRVQRMLLLEELPRRYWGLSERYSHSEDKNTKCVGTVHNSIKRGNTVSTADSRLEALFSFFSR